MNFSFKKNLMIAKLQWKIHSFFKLIIISFTLIYLVQFGNNTSLWHSHNLGHCWKIFLLLSRWFFLTSWSGLEIHKVNLGWEDNIKMDLQEFWWGGMGWIVLAQDRDRWRALVNTVMNLLLSQNTGNFLTSWGTISFSIRTLLHEVI
jgi:hypothetical protein